MASNTDVVKKLYYNMSVLCLYLCVCMSVANIDPYIKTYFVVYGHINFKLGGNYQRGSRRVWYTF